LYDLYDAPQADRNPSGTGASRLAFRAPQVVG